MKGYKLLAKLCRTEADGRDYNIMDDAPGRLRSLAMRLDNGEVYSLRDSDMAGINKLIQDVESEAESGMADGGWAKRLRKEYDAILMEKEMGAAEGKMSSGGGGGEEAPKKRGIVRSMGRVVGGTARVIVKVATLGKVG